jgi:hypothetical protein
MIRVAGSVARRDGLRMMLWSLGVKAAVPQASDPAANRAQDLCPADPWLLEPILRLCDACVLRHSPPAAHPKTPGGGAEMHRFSRHPARCPAAGS